MKNKIIIPIFVVLFLAGAIPFRFTATNSYLFGWLPIPLVYWWALMFVNLIFVLLVSKHFVKTSEKEGDNI